MKLTNLNSNPFGRLLSRIKYRRDIHVPRPLFEDDIFLVSYPRSGNTWLRFIMANLIYPDAEIDYKNISDFIPAGAGRADHNLKMNINRRRPRLIKTHVSFHRKLPRVIYLVRDGRDVYVSYFNFLRERLPANMTLAEFLHYKDLPYGTWSKHIFSWFNSGRARNQFQILYYEDLLRDSVSAIRVITEFAGIRTTDGDIQAAVEKASFNRMRKLEQEKGLPSRNVYSGKFIRSGSAGGWQEKFNELDKQVFKKLHNHALIRAGYEIDDSW